MRHALDSQWRSRLQNIEPLRNKSYKIINNMEIWSIHLQCIIFPIMSSFTWCNLVIYIYIIWKGWLFLYSGCFRGPQHKADKLFARYHLAVIHLAQQHISFFCGHWHFHWKSGDLTFKWIPNVVERMNLLWWHIFQYVLYFLLSLCLTYFVHMVGTRMTWSSMMLFIQLFWH